MSCEIAASRLLRTDSVSAATAADCACRPTRRARAPARAASECVEQMRLLGQQDAARIGRQDGEHAKRAALASLPSAAGNARRRRAACRCRGPQAERGRAPIARPTDRRRAATPARALQRGYCSLPCASGSSTTPATRTLRRCGAPPARHTVDATRRRQLAAHRVQQRGASFAVAGHPRLQAHAVHQRADQDSDRHQHREREQVLPISDVEGEQRRNEEEVVGDGADDRREHRGTAAEAQRDQRDRQQVDHHDVRLVENRVGTHADAVAAATRERENILRPAPLARRRRFEVRRAARKQRTACCRIASVVFTTVTSIPRARAAPDRPSTAATSAQVRAGSAHPAARASRCACARSSPARRRPTDRRA